jgi:hypothetical protein
LKKPGLISLIPIWIVIISVVWTQFNNKNWERPEKVIQWDVINYYAYLPAFFYYGDLSMSFIDQDLSLLENKFWPHISPTGKYTSKMSMGLSFMYLPFYGLGHVHATFSGEPADGFSPPFAFWLVFSALFYITIGLFFLRKALLRYFTHGITALTILLVFFGTNLLYYTTVEAPMPHSYSFALFSGFIYYTIQWHDNFRFRYAIYLGILLGLISLIRPSNALIILFFLFFQVTSFSSINRKLHLLLSNRRSLLVVALFASIVWIPQLIYWKQTTGQFFYYSYQDEQFFFNNPQIWKGLFGYRKGWFVYTPVMLMAVLSIALLMKKNREFFLPIALFTVLNIYIILSWWCWWYGGTYGHRAFIESYALLSIPLATLLTYGVSHRKKVARFLTFALVIVFVAHSIFQTLQFHYNAIHYDAMSKKAYWDSFLKISPSPQFNTLLIYPDYESAKLGKGKIISERNARFKEKSEEVFVYLDGKNFKIRDKTFFPIMLNYVVTFRNSGDDFWLSPIRDYGDVQIYDSGTREGTHEKIHAHMQLIREMGFNSLRICFDRIVSAKTISFYKADNQRLYIRKDRKIIIDALEQFLEIVAQHDLRVMLLIKAPVENFQLENFTVTLLERFAGNPVIFAYDFFNEPLYFDVTPLPGNAREKKDAWKIVSRWKELMNQHAPHQLLTIGFAEPTEVFEWDPEILPVDFLAFHTYHPLRVPNEIFWYGNYISKPWMIGETALPADNDSISYQEQKIFMREVYKRVVDCGGSGLGWWGFKDIAGTYFEENFSGLINNQGRTITQDGNYVIQGTPKPAVNEISLFSDYNTPQPCLRAGNYYNILGYENFMLKGKIINGSDNTPVEGAVVRGWNKWFIIGVNTFTDENGNFTLYSNDECIHFEISAPGMTKLKFDFRTEYKSLPGNDISMEKLPDRNLEYQQISFQPFLKIRDYNNPDYRIFDFDSTKFNSARFEGLMPLQILYPLALD